MKTLSCDLCEHKANGETFADWMNALKPHYMEAHSDVMNDKGKTRDCLLYTSPSPRDRTRSRMPSSA